MFSKINKKMRKTTLSLALTAAFAGVAGTAQAVNLTPDGLGDAAIFQYYTANADWKTFIRLLNTSNDAVAVKVRFREAANSRDVLDFVVFMSPHDTWTAWTSASATPSGAPGIRTADTSCLLPLVDNTDPDEGFETVNGNVKAAAFKDRAFTGIYNDNGGMASDMRFSEGHIEVIGVAKWDPNGGFFGGAERDMAHYITHNIATGKPNDCAAAVSYFNAGNNSSGDNVGNVIAANAYLINVNAGQGAGYDPTILANFTNQVLINETNTNGSDTKPDMDSAQPVSRMLNDDGSFVESFWGDNNGAFNQLKADGTLVPGTITHYKVDFDGDGVVLADPVAIDVDGSGICEADEQFTEGQVPKAVYDQLFDASGAIVTTGVGGVVAPCTRAIRGLDQNGGGNRIPVAYGAGTTTPAMRTAQLGNLGAQAVTGGVDAVSSLLMRTSVDNEWAASYNPGAPVSDYFTQWVLTFPTKHYYVDLQNDADSNDDVSPTLVDPNVSTNDAYAPFSQEFDDGTVAGTSCESYDMSLWNREERRKDFTSPRPNVIPSLCYETNVLSFNERYTDLGLDSNFATTVPALLLPRDYNGDISERGWGRLTFTSAGSTTGLTGYNGTGTQATHYYGGLPVDGFMFSIYNTNSSANNHAAINAHKYERNID